MIKWSRLRDGAWICQSIAEKIHQVLLFLQRKSDRLNVRVHDLVFAGSIEIAAAVVKFHHLFQRQLSAVVEVRSGERNVAQLRNFEVSSARNVISAVQGALGDAVTRASRDHQAD